MSRFKNKHCLILIVFFLLNIQVSFSQNITDSQRAEEARILMGGQPNLSIETKKYLSNGKIDYSNYCNDINRLMTNCFNDPCNEQVYRTCVNAMKVDANTIPAHQLDLVKNCTSMLIERAVKLEKLRESCKSNNGVNSTNQTTSNNSQNSASQQAINNAFSDFQKALENNRKINESRDQKIKDLDNKKVQFGLEHNELSKVNSNGNTSIDGELTNNIASKSIFDIDNSDKLSEEGGGLKDFVSMQNTNEEATVPNISFDANDEKSEMATEDYNDFKKGNLNESNSLNDIYIKGVGEVVDWGTETMSSEFAKNIGDGFLKSVLSEKKTMELVANDEPNSSVIIDKLTQSMPEGRRELVKQNLSTAEGAGNMGLKLIKNPEYIEFDDEKEIEETSNMKSNISKKSFSFFTDKRVKTAFGGAAIIGVTGIVAVAAIPIVAPIVIVGSALKILTSGW